MDQQRIILESSPAYLLVCLALALGFAFLMYQIKGPWTKTWKWILFGMRAVLAFFLMFLLLGPIVKQINNLFEKPVLVFLYDTSSSVKEGSDSTSIQKLSDQLSETVKAANEKGFDTRISNLNGDEGSLQKLNETTSDLSGGLKKISNQYEGRNIHAVVLVSDGIYNQGVSPLYASYPFPVYTLGLGDTLERTDIAVKNLMYNKIAYQGNRFPVRVELMVKNLPNQTIEVSLLKRGKLLDKQTKNSSDDQFLLYDFQPQADEQGIQKLDVQVEIKNGEYNTRNNQASIFIEVVEGKKKILFVSAAPHPDSKALREVIDKNSNYEFLLHIPGVSEQPASVLQPEQIDLVIFHQSPALRGKTKELFQKFSVSKTSLFLILGQQSDLQTLAKLNMPITFETPPRDFDEVLPVVNSTFSNFSISPEASAVLENYPPVSVHFGKIKISATASPILYQRIGNMATQKMLLGVDEQNNRKIGFMLGEGLWRWRLNEFDRNENTIAFDEIFGKLIQYLSTTDDKRKFKSYPIQQEFSETQPVVFESQVYNDLYEPVYGNAVDIELTDENSKKTKYNYTLSLGNERYTVGNLKEGVYKYKSKTSVNQKSEEVRGEFAVVARQAELQNLKADFGLLRKLSANTGGKFYSSTQANLLQKDLTSNEAKQLIHTEETYNSIINLKWVFVLLLLLVSTEWFSRRYFGGY
ncbi:MAG TPA: VWA domain-containing protein [Chryseolinea sp.]|nr:VWA domain-containing protein [Chryseolinea sp.]